MESAQNESWNGQVSGRLLYTEDNGDSGTGIEDQTGRDYENGAGSEMIVGRNKDGKI